MTDWSK
jgi:hypothetical protein